MDEAVLNKLSQQNGKRTAPRPGGPDSLGFFGAMVVIAALLSALATFVVLAGLTPIEPTERVSYTLLSINAVLALFLLLMVLRQGIKLFRARRAGVAATRLHVRFVMTFAAIATVPVVVVALVASMTLQRGLDPWFSGWCGSRAGRDRVLSCAVCCD